MALKVSEPKYLTTATDCNRGRVYYDMSLDEKDRLYVDSVTTIIDHTLAKGYGFDKWLGNSLSYEHAMEYAEKKALDGSMTHDFIDMLIKGNEVDTDLGYYDVHSKEQHIVSDRVKKRLLGFMKFVEEINPQFIASELPLFNPATHEGDYQYLFAGCVDMIANIDNELWLLDTKTGNAYDLPHELQLTAYKLLWDSLYGEEHGEIKRIGCLYLGDGWRLKPTYKLKEYEFRPDVWLMILELYKYVFKDKKNNDKLQPPKFKREHPSKFKLNNEGEE